MLLLGLVHDEVGAQDVLLEVKQNFVVILAPSKSGKNFFKRF